MHSDRTVSDLRGAHPGNLERRAHGSGDRRRNDARDAGEVARDRGTLGLGNVEFREGLAERLPVEDGWADVVVSNGVINLCADKRAVFDEIRRVLRPGGWLQFADIATVVRSHRRRCAT
jgi:ubiquinone/menaquinone biosynthesis C-methylase UbiE